MDYASGTVIAKWQWDMIYDPAIVNGVFDEDKEAMATETSAEILNKYEELIAKYPNGVYLALHGFTCKDKVPNKINIVNANPELRNSKILFTKTLYTNTGAVTAIIFSIKKETNEIIIDGFKVFTKEELSLKMKGKLADTDNFLEFYTKDKGNFKALKRCDNWGGLQNEACGLTINYSETAFNQYLQNILDQITLCKSKNIMLFVNGYRTSAKDLEVNKNLVENYDINEYWEGIDMLFRERRKSLYWFYADGHMSISTSNHKSEINFANSIRTAYCTRYPISESTQALALIIKHPAMKYISKTIELVCASDAAESCYHKPECVILNDKPNVEGYDIRSRNGRQAGARFVTKLKEIGVAASDTLDIVCHSFGFAYAQGMIEVIRETYPDIHLGGYYIIAPENACTGTVNPNEWDQIWQYGTDEQNTDKWMRDGVATQCPIRNIGANRAFIPTTEPQGFLESHFISNYGWIFNTLNMGQDGYVKPRK